MIRWLKRTKNSIHAVWIIRKLFWKIIVVWDYRGPYEMHEFDAFMSNHYPFEWNQVKALLGNQLYD